MTALDAALLRSNNTVERMSANLQASWVRRRKWTRTDSSRWLNDRADAVNSAALRLGLVMLQRSDGVRVPSLPKAPGDALRVNNAAAFDRIHTRLAALDGDAARDTALVPEIVR